MVLLGKMLKMNPDLYTLWNFRRDVIISKFPELLLERTPRLEGQSSDTVRDVELKLTEEGIQRNPKSCKALFSQ